MSFKSKIKGGEFKFKFGFIDNLFAKLSRKQDYFKFTRSNEDSDDMSLLCYFLGVFIGDLKSRVLIEYSPQTSMQTATEM